MKILLHLVLNVIIMLGLFLKGYSQCNAYTISEYNTASETVTYTSNFGGLDMDVFQPVGDNSLSRPLIILAHGGSFLTGSRSEMRSLCKHFAERGYVAATISYRLGSYTLDTVLILETVLKAMNDAKAAVRYFTKDAATVNNFRINPDMIAVGGFSAGAILAVHYAYVNSTNEVAPYIQNLIIKHGGIHGNSGNDGYPDKVHAVVNLAGAINRLKWIDAGEPAIISCHGTDDAIVPYQCDDIFKSYGFDLNDVCGGGAMKPVLDAKGIENVLFSAQGGGHGVYCSNDDITDFLAPIVCERMGKEIITSTEFEDDNENIFSLFPNPTNGNLTILSEVAIDKLILYDIYGRTVFEEGQLQKNATIDLSFLQSGIYSALLISNDNINLKTRKLIVN